MLAAMLSLADDDDPSGVVFACVFLLIIVVGGAYAVIWLRRRYWGKDDDMGVGQMGFTLGDLRHLHKSGQISKEEFDKAKEKVVAAAKRAAEREANPPGPNAPNQRPGGQ
jgi:hypothetical protein